MRALLLVAVLAVLAPAHAQEAGQATFLEIAQVIVDVGASEATASVTLQSTDSGEIRFPPDLEERIRQDGRIKAVVLTNEDACVLGVSDRSCILVNVERDPADRGINAIQNSTKAIGDEFIAEISRAFGVDAQFHSVFIHGGSAGEQLGSEGVIVGRNIISAVYTTFQENTDQMYARITDNMLSSGIRGAGGFYDVGRGLSERDGAIAAFSIIPRADRSLAQIKVSAPDSVPDPGIISPLGHLGAAELSRSGHFASGFYPLNSIVQVVVVSPEPETVSARAPEVPTQTAGGEKIPTDLSAPGWVFDPAEGTTIQGKYLFGSGASASARDLELVLGDGGAGAPEYAVLVAIAAAAAAAAAFYLRGYKRSQ